VPPPSSGNFTATSTAATQFAAFAWPLVGAEAGFDAANEGLGLEPVAVGLEGAVVAVACGVGADSVAVAAGGAVEACVDAALGLRLTTAAPFDGDGAGALGEPPRRTPARRSLPNVKQANVSS
jgi:hypothetical protein